MPTFPDVPPAFPGLVSHVKGLSPELRLLLTAAMPGALATIPGCAARFHSLCRTGVHWPDFLAGIHAHGLACLTAAGLTAVETSLVPGDVRVQLQQMVLRDTVAALRYASELRRLHGLFAARGVDLIPLKGTSLSSRLYCSPTLRQVQDLDILVRPEDLQAAEMLLVEQGYLCTDPDFAMTPRMRRAVLDWTHHFHFQHPETGLVVELHWRFDFWPAEAVATLWQRRIRLSFEGVELQELDDDALLVYLCSHGARHAWLRCKWLNDIAALLARPRATPWEDLFRLAGHLDQTRALAQAATLVNVLYQVPLDEPLLRFIADQRLPDVFLCRPLALLEVGDRRDSLSNLLASLLDRFRYVFCLNRNVSHRHYLRIILFRPEYTARLGIPDRLFWLHSLLGPLFWFLYRGHLPGDGGPASARAK